MRGGDRISPVMVGILGLAVSFALDSFGFSLGLAAAGGGRVGAVVAVVRCPAGTLAPKSLVLLVDPAVARGSTGGVVVVGGRDSTGSP